MKSRWNQEMSSYTMLRKIIELGVMQEPQFPHLGTVYVRKI